MNQGYKDLDKLFLFNNKGANNLCTIVRKSSTTSTGAITLGLMIPSLAQKQLKLSIFALKHKKRVSCEAKLDQITQKEVQALCQQRQMELSFDSKTNSYAQATFKNLAKTFEWVHKQLEHCRGMTGVPLAYIVRPTLIPKYEDKDPETDYPNLDAKISVCTPILEDEDADPDQSLTDIKELEEDGLFYATFRIDMVTCWSILYEMFGGTPTWLHCQKIKNEKNGRKLFCILFAQILVLTMPVTLPPRWKLALQT